MRIFEDISFTDEQLQPIVNWCQSNIEFSPVVTKFNKNNQWTAVSVRGYAGTIEQIGKGGVLGTLDDLNKLQNTPLYDELMMDKQGTFSYISFFSRQRKVENFLQIQ